MRIIIGSLFLSSAVFFNSIEASSDEENESNHDPPKPLDPPLVENLPPIKVFRFQPLPNYSGLRMNIDQKLFPLCGKITLVATRDDILIGWINLGSVRPLYNSKRQLVVHYMITNQTVPMPFWKLIEMGVFSRIRNFPVIFTESSEEAEFSVYREHFFEHELELERERERSENARECLKRLREQTSAPISEFDRPPIPLLREKQPIRRRSRQRRPGNPEQ